MCFILNVHIIFYIKTHESWVITRTNLSHNTLRFSTRKETTTTRRKKYLPEKKVILKIKKICGKIKTQYCCILILYKCII